MSDPLEDILYERIKHTRTLLASHILKVYIEAIFSLNKFWRVNSEDFKVYYLNRLSLIPPGGKHVHFENHFKLNKLSKSWIWKNGRWLVTESLPIRRTSYTFLKNCFLILYMKLFFCSPFDPVPRHFLYYFFPYDQCKCL